MKTIFIPIQSRAGARNVLRTDIIRTLARANNLRIVVFAPSFKIDLYQKEFSDLGIFFEGVADFSENLSFLDSFFNRIAFFYIDTPAARFYRKKFIFYERKQPVRYFVSFFFLLVFGNIKLLRRIFRSLDLFFVRDNRLAFYFDKYQPDIVFSPDITNSFDLSFIRYAKKHGVQTTGMIKAWDNIPIAKYCFRILPDKIICYNEPIQRDVIKYLDIKKENTFVSGMPHFDFYFSEQRSSREEFCRRLGIDSKKRIILFAAIGEGANPTESQTAALLSRAIQDGKISDDIVVIFRHHPTEKKYTHDLPENKNFIIDDSKTFFKQSGHFSEILDHDMKHLADSIFHADIVITTCSTMSIDSSAFNKPIIDIAFDGWEERPFYNSVRRYYTKYEAHYVPIVKSKGTSIAFSLEELISYTKQYLDNPELNAEGRKKIALDYCYKLDGQSGKRIGEYLLTCAGL